MNKTVTANISGVVFHIESEAYDHLHNYLNTIRKYFHDSEGKDEIMADIEARIAELFKEEMDLGKEVVTMANVKKVIEIMGEPEQYMDGDDDYQASGSDTTFRKENRFYSKKLFRDTDENLLGGVCAGIGHYFGVDKIWFRIAFLIAFFGFGAGFLLYIILWIIIPAAKTTAEKLEMRGEPINIDSIGNAIKDEFGNFKKKVNSGAGASYRNKAEVTLYRVFDFLAKLVVFLFKFLLKFIAVILVIGAVTGIIALFGLFIGGPMLININNEDVGAYFIGDLSDMIFTSPIMYTLGLIGLALVSIIPLIGLLYGGLKLLFPIPRTNRAVGLTALSLWVIGVIILIISATTTASQFSSSQQLSETITLDPLAGDTLILSSMGNTYSNGGRDLELFAEEGNIYHNNFEIDVIRSKNDQINLYMQKSARGKNRKEAGKRAENIKIEYDLMGHELSISPFIHFPQEDKFRKQEVEMSIGLPVGTTIFLDHSSREIIYDIENVTNTYDGKMMGHHWLMTEEGLRCTDCPWLEESEAPLPEGMEEKPQEIEEKRRALEEEAEEMRERARELQEEEIEL
jgi:phage shock protein PspC (stress-responsive transcriptional regulator)